MGLGSQQYEVIKMALPSQGNIVAAGAQTPATTQGEYNKIAFAISQAMSKMKTSTLVRVDKCTNDGGLTAVGYVDVTPLVNQVDSNGKATPHKTIFGIPYLRIQGGTNAIIIDPVAGDIGMCSFASRDLSKVKSTKQPANPGSDRQYSFSDGMYVGGMLNGMPVQYVQMNDTGIKIFSPNKVTIEADNVEVIAHGPCSVTSEDTTTITAGGDVNVSADGNVNVTGATINLN